MNPPIKLKHLISLKTKINFLMIYQIIRPYMIKSLITFFQGDGGDKTMGDKKCIPTLMRNNITLTVELILKPECARNQPIKFHQSLQDKANLSL